MGRHNTRNTPEEQVLRRSARNAHSDVLPYDSDDSTSTTSSIGRHTQGSSTSQFEVFISHAGDDKATIAIPLRNKLRKRGIKAFVDECDIARGTVATEAMERAMNTARIAVFVLSPEFVARKWPIKELMHFLKRVEECNASRQEPPAIIPFFYRLSIKETYKEPNFDRTNKEGNKLYEESRFLQRQADREPEANTYAIKKALGSLCEFMGLENTVDASNDSCNLMTGRRDKLLRELCKYVCKAAAKTSKTKEEKVKDQDISQLSTERNARDTAELNRHTNMQRDGTESTDQNAEKAVELYRLAIKDGDVRAMNNLANLLAHGADGVEPNEKEAAELYREAIRRGHNGAKNNLANLLRRAPQHVTFI